MSFLFAGLGDWGSFGKMLWNKRQTQPMNLKTSISLPVAVRGQVLFDVRQENGSATAWSILWVLYIS